MNADVTQQALDLFTAQLNGIKDAADQREFTTMMATLYICLVRGMHGDKFCRGYLEGALLDLDKPSVRYIAPSQH